MSIGERLGRVTSGSTPARPLEKNDISVDDYVGSGRSSDVAVAADSIPSSSYVPPQVERVDDGGPRRVRGEMVWLHKTAPTLVIEGRPGLTPEEHAAGRRR